MPTAYLHIGQHKTGTTSFQGFMEINRKWLGKQGLYVPDTGRSPQGAHHQLTLSLMEIVENPKILKLAGQFVKEIKRKKYPDLLISSETISRFFPHEDLESKLSAFFTDLGYTIVPIMVLRDIVPAKVSSYSQITKTMYNHLSFADHIHSVTKKRPNPPADKPVQHSMLWKNLAKYDSIVIPYNAHTRKQGIAKTILKQFGVKGDIPDEQFLNNSVSDAQIYAARWLGKHIEETSGQVSAPQQPMLAARMSKLIDAKFEKRPRYNPLTKEIVDFIIENRQIRQLDDIAQRYWNTTWDQAFEDERALSFETNDWMDAPELCPSQEELDVFHAEILDIWRSVQLEIPYNEKHNVPNEVNAKIKKSRSE
jgi:hypothetical protein